MWLIERLGALPGLDNLVLTTNGSQLDRFATPLRAAGVKRINISLDTLRADRFQSITRIGDLNKVLSGIDAARAAGFKRTKLNTVMMRGVNDDEFVDLVSFAIDNELDISFIEEMPLGEIHGRSNTFISSEETRALLAQRYELIPSTENSGGPARYWRIPGSESRIGFISPQPQFLRYLQSGAHNCQGRTLPLPRAKRCQQPVADLAFRQRRCRTPGHCRQHGNQAFRP
jgi:cyclic pyranopterin phosphate synthase